VDDVVILIVKPATVQGTLDGMAFPSSDSSRLARNDVGLTRDRCAAADDKENDSDDGGDIRLCKERESGRCGGVRDSSASDA